jgi:hypothetical protein
MFFGTTLKNVDNVPATDMPQSSIDTSSPFFSRQVCGGVFSHIILRVKAPYKSA